MSKHNEFMHEIVRKRDEAVSFISSRTKTRPRIGVIFGTGLSHITKEKFKLKDHTVVKFCDIPHFKSTEIESHNGELVFTEVAGKEIVFVVGRYHLYEGHDMQDIVFPVHVLKALGVENLIITSSVGGVSPSQKRGDLIIIKDYINFSKDPRISYDDSLGTRFMVAATIFDESFRKKIKAISREREIGLNEGVMFFLTGPSYETYAEAKAIRSLGADVIGWSTVPEANVAFYLGIKILAICCITDISISLEEQKKREGNLEEEHDKQHREEKALATIICIAKKSSGNLNVLIEEFIKNLES